MQVPEVSESSVEATVRHVHQFLVTPLSQEKSSHLKEEGATKDRCQEDGIPPEYGAL